MTLQLDKKRNAFSDETLFCIRHLRDLGYLDVSSNEAAGSLLEDFTGNYKLTKINQPVFYIHLAEKMRKLWPAGEKDGKYPWRDSVSNLANRLELLWQIRGLGTYTVEECLTVARRYLSQFENNVKYMQTLKYFILKKKEVATVNGTKRYNYTSQFASMLESSTPDELHEDDIENNYMDGGMLI